MIFSYSKENKTQARLMSHITGDENCLKGLMAGTFTTLRLYVSPTHGFNYSMPASQTKRAALFIHITKLLKNEVRRLFLGLMEFSSLIFTNQHVK